MVEKAAEKDKRKYSRELLNKTIISKTGKIFGKVGDIVFETRTGELINIILKNPTETLSTMDVEKDRNGIKIPFSSVIAIGDFVVVSEEDIV